MTKQFVDEQRIRALQGFAVDSGCSFAAIQIVILQDIAAALERISLPHENIDEDLPNVYVSIIKAEMRDAEDAYEASEGEDYRAAFADGVRTVHNAVLSARRPAPAPEDKETEIKETRGHAKKNQYGDCLACLYDEALGPNHAEDCPKYTPF